MHKEGVPIKPAFQINGTACFHAVSDGSVMLNGDMAFKAEELNPAIDQMLRHGLVWQALHQHLWGLQPMVWFMHFRGRGSARKLAEAVRAVLSVTSTPLPQAPPKHPTTPLDARRLSKIIGQPATVGASGVVTINVPRRDRIILGGVRISPELNVFTPRQLRAARRQPGGGGPRLRDDRRRDPEGDRRHARAGLGTGLPVQPGDRRAPQLYFDHMFKVGDAYQLAQEVRRGLEQMNVAIH